MNFFKSFITCKRTNNANNAIHYVKLSKNWEFQTQLLHYFSKSDNQSNHHHLQKRPIVLRSLLIAPYICLFVTVVGSGFRTITIKIEGWTWTLEFWMICASYRNVSANWGLKTEVWYQRKLNLNCHVWERFFIFLDPFLQARLGSRKLCKSETFVSTRVG